MSITRYRYQVIIFSLNLISLLLLMVEPARGQEDLRILEQGKPIEKELKGGQCHSYQIKLAAGQFLRLVAEQKGIDLLVKSLGPDGKQIVELDRQRSTQGLEEVFCVAEKEGSYQFNVCSAEKQAEMGRYEIRIEELRQAIEKDKSRIAGEVAFAEGSRLEREGGAGSLKRAIEKYEEAMVQWRVGEERSWEAQTLNNIGKANSNLGENQKALDCYNQALPIFRDVGNRSGEALVLNNFGNVYYNLGEHQKALDYYNQALLLRRAVGERRGEAGTLNNIGNVYNILGEHQKALDYYNQALLLARTVGDHIVELAAISNLGTVYNTLGEYQKALDYHNQALSFRRAMGDRRGEAMALNNIGIIYNGLGETQKALDYYNQALPLRRAVGDRSGEAVTLHSIGRAYYFLGEPQKALDYYNQALSLRRAVGDRSGESYTLINIGIIYKELGEYQKALGYYNQALPLDRAVGFPGGEAYTLNNIGIIYHILGENQKALDFLNQALLLSRTVGDRKVEADTLYYTARAERTLGHLEQARKMIEDALKLIDFIRSSVNDQQLRASYSASVRDYYELYIDLLMQLHQLNPKAGYDAASVEASEKSHARSLLELLAESHADIRQGIDPQLLDRERSLKQRLNVKAERLIRLLNGKYTEEQKAEAEKELNSLTTEFQQLQSEIRQKSSRYAALTQPQPLSLKEIQTQILDPDTILLEYSLGKERSFLWAITPSSIESIELPKRELIETRAQQVYKLLTARKEHYEKEEQARWAEADKDYSIASAELSKMILSPVASQLGKKRLIVVADGALQYLPFGALPSPIVEGRPLIVEHEIVSLPSASVMAVMRHETADRKQATKTIAVLADPVFDKEDERVKTAQPAERTDEQITDLFGARILRNIAFRTTNPSRATSDKVHVPRLLFTRQEAESIIAVAAKDSSMKALDFEASRLTASSPELSQYRYVHFATHGYLDSERPELSAIVLSLVDDKGKQQDGFLRTHEIFNLNLPVELVVLSACETGLGKDIKGEGLVGLTRGFMYAGAARVVVSLWSVNDKATAELMGRFYKKMLKEGQKPASALRSAQVEMLKEEKWKEPFYWAAFVLQGEWR